LYEEAVNPESAKDFVRYRAIRRALDLTAAIARAPHNAVAGSTSTRRYFPPIAGSD
jgi:hypothetical protein